MKTLRGFALVFSLIASVLVNPGAGQEAVSPGRVGQEAAPPARVIVPPDPDIARSTDFRIRPSEIVSVYIINMPELSRDYPVSAEGTIELPFLGSMKAQQKTSNELSAMIADRLRGDYLVDPQVTVSVKSTVVTYRFFVQGAVRTPGVYNLEVR